MTYRELIRNEINRRWDLYVPQGHPDFGNMERWREKRLQRDGANKVAFWLLKELGIDSNSKVDPFDGMENLFFGKEK